MRLPRKKVLVITYYFPPSGGAGVQRTLKFIKYLRDFGWEPVVLTVKNADYPAYDETLESELPKGIQIYRSRIIEPYRLYRKFTGRRSDESTDIATQSLDQSQKRKLSERISEWLRSCFFIPDARISWLFFAYTFGKKILQQEEIELIYSSAPPYTTHLIGRKLSGFSKLPWVADFRDSWIGWLSTPQWRPRLSRAVERKMERAVLREADRIITVTYGVKEDLLSRHPEMRDERWVFLPNGYDPPDFECVIPKPKNEKMTITYIGSIFGSRNPEYLIRALESLKDDNSVLLEKLKFRFVGRVGAPILKRIECSPVKNLFEIVPYVTHAESLSYLTGSDVSLLIIDDVPASRGILTGKLFEYIGAGKPILALAPEGEAADLIRKNNLGVVVPPKDIKGIRTALTQLYKKRTGPQKIQHTDSNLREQFARREQTRRLAEILDDLISVERRT